MNTHVTQMESRIDCCQYCCTVHQVLSLLLLHRSCRVAPLIQCDYCALLFHMDCLDPPLTAMPTGRWMCPNHVEHMVVSGSFLSVLHVRPVSQCTRYNSGTNNNRLQYFSLFSLCNICVTFKL